MLEAQVQKLALDAAVNAGRTGSLPPGFLDEMVSLFGADAGVGYTSCYLVAVSSASGGVAVDRASMQAAGAPQPPDGILEQGSTLALSHPGIRALSSSSVTRVSDLIRMKAFWGTPVFEVMHGWVNGRYPMAAQLHADGRRVDFIGLNRQHRDFTDKDVEALRAIQRPLVAAFTYRNELDMCIERLQQATTGRASTSPSSDPVAAGVAELCHRYQPTRREAEVLALVSAGWTNRKIGRQLGITERTVREHLTHVYEKSGKAGRAAAAVWWRDRA